MTTTFSSLEWAKFTYIADEMVIPTLSRVRVDSLSEVNGTWSLLQDQKPVRIFRFAYWKKLGEEEKCKGYWRRKICVFSIADLSKIVKSSSPIINKVMTNHDPALGECLRESVRGKELIEN